MSDEWFKKYIETLDSRIGGLEKKVDDNFKSLDEKVEQLLKFKWQIGGGAIVVSTVFGILVHILIAYIGK